MKFKALLAAVVITAGPVMAQPQKVQDEFFDEGFIRGELAEIYGGKAETFTAKDIKDYRVGVCAAWYEPVNGKRLLSGQMKDVCLTMLRQAGVIAGEGAGATPAQATAPAPTRTASSATSSADPCLDARDYVGCKKVKSGAVRTKPHKNHVIWNNALTGKKMILFRDSVRAKKIRGEYGRYVTFKYGVRFWSPGSSGYTVPGITTPVTATTTLTSNGFGGATGYTTYSGGTEIGGYTVPGSSAGWRALVLTATGDCKDMTVDVDKNGRGWEKAKNTRPILDWVCPRINKYVAKANNTENFLVADEAEDNSSDAGGKNPYKWEG